MLIYASIEYWFRCLDMDGNGIITMYELEHFYDEQLRKMEDLGMETLSFKDCLCQVLLYSMETLSFKDCLCHILKRSTKSIEMDYFFKRIQQN